MLPVEAYFYVQIPTRFFSNLFSMNQKETVRQFNDFIFRDNDKAFAVLAEDVTMEWPGWGMEPLRGRDVIRTFMETNGPEEMTDITLQSLIEEGAEVIGHGHCTTVKDGKSGKSFFADCYTLRDGKIARIVSYMVMEKKEK